MTETKPKWITPFMKQCFVTLGVAVNMVQLGLIMGLPTTLVPQLRDPTSPIPIDDNYGSWIAAIPGFTFLVGNFTTPSIMGRFGRKIGNLCSLTVIGLGWIFIVFSSNITVLLIGRSLQGVGMGMTSILGPVSVGEYTSPKHRGAFLMSLSVAISLGVLIIHTIGLYLNWFTVAIICVVITALNFTMIVFSPESPSWLASQGRYDDCKVNFHWLRGDTEDEELEKLIDANVAHKKSLEISDNDTEKCVTKIKNNLVYCREIFRKPEFYKPIIIMMHIYTAAHWSGVNIFATYAVDMIHMVAGEDANVSLMMISFDVQRAISNAIALIIIAHVKRKTMLISTVTLNLTAMLVTAGYVYAKSHNLLSYDSPYIGLGLAHVHMFSIATGALPLSFILAGEVFPLQYKGIAGGISALTFAVNIFTAVKSAPYLFKGIGLHGTYIVYCGVVIFCLIVAIVILPETKDRTLQDIEEDFKGKKKDLEKIDIVN